MDGPLSILGMPVKLFQLFGELWYKLIKLNYNTY